MNLRCVSIITGVVIVVAVTAILASLPSIRVSYHLNRMHAAQDTFWDEPTTITTGGDVLHGNQEILRKHVYHRDCLVDLGYYFHAVYEMENLPDDDDNDQIHGALWKLITTAFPENDQLTLSTRRNVIEVWDLQSRRAEWESFVKKHNVVGFRERFTSDEAN